MQIIICVWFITTKIFCGRRLLMQPFFIEKIILKIKAPALMPSVPKDNKRVSTFTEHSFFLY